MAVLGLAPQCVTHAVGGVAGEFWHDVRISAERKTDLRVTENLHYDARRHPLRQQKRGRGMPRVV